MQRRIRRVHLVRAALALTAGVLTAHLAACASAGGAVDDPFRDQGDRGGGRGGRVTMTVVNRNLGEVTLTALVGGRRERLGTVVSRQEKGFAVSFDNAGTLRIEVATTIGVESYVTPPIGASPGDHLILVVEQNIRDSRLYH